MIDLVESGLADAVEYADIQSRIEDISAAVTIQRYGPVWTEHNTEPTRDGDEFDAIIAGAFLLRVYLDGASDIEIERLADESGGDLAWITVAVSGNASLIDLDVAPSLVANGLTARVFYYSTDGAIKYMENTDVSVNAFTAPVVVGAVANVVHLAAVSLTKVYYITENSNNNRVLHVYELNGAWANTDSDIYWPYPVHAFDAVTFETGRDLLILAADLPPLIGSRVVGAEVTQEVNKVQGVVVFWAANGRWSDHSIIDVIDRVETTPSRTSLRLSLHNNILFGAYLRCGGTEDYPYSKAAVIKSKDGVNWEFPELIDNFTPPFVILPRTDYLYAVGVDKVLRSPCCSWAGQTPVELDVTQYVVGLESSAAEIRNSQVRLSDPANVLASTLATESARLQVVYDLGYVVGGSNLRVTVSTEDIISRGEQAVLPHQGVGLTTRDFLGRVNRVRSDYAAEWPGIQAGRDTYNDPSETGYGGLRHTAPYEGSWKTPGDEEIHLLSKNKEGLAVSTFVTDALNGSAETGFQVNTAGNSEYAGIAFRTFDKDNLNYFIYDQNTDKLKLIKGVGTDSDADGERDNTALATSYSVMSWSVDTWYWLKVIVRYSLVYAFYSTDGITWVAVTWDDGVGGSTNPIELVSSAGNETEYSILSGRFGLIGYGYSANDTWPPYDPPPWTPPTDPSVEGPIKACVAWTKDQIGYTSDLLLHHYTSAATAGTIGTTLHDTSADFLTLGVAVGDAIEEMGVAPIPANTTTVAAVVSATQLTLAADIGLVATSEYHTCGAQWVDIKGTISGTILHFVHVVTGANTAEAWVLTDTGVYYTANILTPSPTWSLKLTKAQAAAGSVGATTGDTQFRWIHGYARSPGYVIVSLWHNQSLNPAGAHLGGYVHTHNQGTSWTWAAMPARSNRVTAYSCLEVNEATGKIWGRRSHNWPPGESRIYYSIDLGTSFNEYDTQNLSNLSGYHQELYNPSPASDSVLYHDRWDPWLSGLHMRSADSGSFFNTLTIAGYTSVSGKSGALGWAGDANDIVMTWKRNSDSHMLLMRSRNNGVDWTEIGDADDEFGGGFGVYYGTTAIISSSWEWDEDVFLWVGLQAGSVGLAQVRRICYTDDNGTHWYNKLGNWFTVFGLWSGASGSNNCVGNAGCCPLPRIGSNK